MRKVIITCIILSVFFLTAIPFIFKAIYCPIKASINLKNNEKPPGDFWNTFPAPFVRSYNPDIFERNKYIPLDRWEYGPIQHLITLPLTFISHVKPVIFIWHFFNYLCIILTLVLLLYILKETSSVAKLMIICFWLGYWPLYIAIQEQVIEIFELLLIIFGLFVLMRKNKKVLCGVIMGFGSMVKFLPLIFLGYFLVKGKIKTFFSMLITIAVIIVATQMTLGWENNATLTLLKLETMNAPHFTTYWRSQTIPSMIERLFSKTDFSPGQITYPVPAKNISVVQLVIILLLLLLISIFLTIFLRRKNDNILTEFSIMLVLMILCIPHSQSYYLIFCLPGYAAVMAFIDKTKNVFLLILLGISYILSGSINQIGIFDFLLLGQINRHYLFYMLSLPAFGAIMLLSSLLIVHHAENTGADPIVL